jgi:hypothetical protein
LSRSRGEELYDDYRLGLARGEDTAHVAHRAEDTLFALAERDRRERIRGRWLSIFGVAVGTVDLIWTAAEPSRLPPDIGIPVGVTALALGGFSLGESFVPSPMERLADVWRRDPSLQLLPTLSTRAGGVRTTLGFTGTGLSLSGTF